MKILVTGGTGFIGFSLVRKLLSQGHDVWVIGRSANPPSNKNFEGVTYRSCNLCHENIPDSIMKGTELVFHVAAKAGIAGTYSQYYSANYQATRNVIESCKSSGVSRLVYTSTPSVTFSSRSIRGGNESLPYVKGKASFYAYSKALAEKAVLNAHDPKTLQTLALRPHLVWGAGDPHLLPRVIERHRKGQLKRVGDGKNKVDLTHIDNVCHAHLCAMERLLEKKDTGGKAYFVGQEEPILLWPWLNDLFGKLEMPALTKSISFRKAHLAGLVLEKCWSAFRLNGDPPMTRFVACQLAHDHWFSSQSAKDDLGYEPITNMEDCLEKTLPWLKSMI